MITTQKELRREFWAQHPYIAEDARQAGVFSKRQNFHCTMVRCMFVDFVDMMHRDGQISDALADRATL